jgi:death-on-curing protein
LANSAIWVWLTVEDAIAIHDDQLARFGGAAGIKSIALLESAMAAPLQFQHYTGENSCIRLGAHLAHAIARNHPFVDGNKRTATIAFLEFLYLHGLEIDLPDTESRQPLAELMEQMASGIITAIQFAETLRPHMREVPH